MATALQREDAKVIALYGAIDDAAADLEAAKRNSAAALVANVLGDSVDPNVIIKRARNDLQNAEDDLEQARQNRDELRRQLDELSIKTWAHDRVKQAALSVIRSEAGEHAKTLTDELAALQIRMFECWRSLTFMVGNKIVPVIEEHGVRFGRPIDSDLANLMVELTTAPGRWTRCNGIPELDGEAIWKAALDRLCRNPHEPLPIDDPRSA
jgi:hypothetical protein